MDSSFILKTLTKRFSHNKLSISNSFVYNEESDFLTITREDITHEIEIKISRGDFKADFKKNKHTYFKSILEGKELSVFRGIEINNTCDISRQIDSYVQGLPERFWNKKNNIFKPWSCSVSIYKTIKTNHPNKFSFAVPVGLIKKEEIPIHYGLYYIDDFGNITEVQRAKFLHKEKFIKWESIAMRFYYRFLSKNNLINL